MPIKDEWKQMVVTHCPTEGCKGMLLQNPFRHYEKCLECGKCYMSITDFVEVEEEGMQEFKELGKAENEK